MKKPKAMIFDLDGVITDTAHYHFLAWKMLAHELGIDFDQMFNQQLKGVSRMASLELILAKGNQLEQFSRKEKKALATKKNDVYKSLIQQMTPDEVMDGIPSLLRRLKEDGILIGLASASKNASTVVDLLKIREAFDYIADASKIKRSKPAPDVFLDVAEAFDCKPLQCIGVEDAKAGIEAIHHGGMFAVGIGENDHLKEADILFPKPCDMDLDRIFHAYAKWIRQ